MEALIKIFSYDFFTNALMAAFLSALLCGIIGTYIVSRRMVFISGGITHSSFGGIGIAYYLGLNPVLGAVVFGVLSALGIKFLSERSKIREDTAIGVLWSVGMAIGIIFIFITPGYAPNLMSFLFGNILTVTIPDLIILLSLTLFTLFFFILFYKPILYISFDEEYARAQKFPVKILTYFLLVLVALTIVINIRIVGIILVISLLTMPQSIANIFTNNFKYIIIWSVVFGLLGSIGGLIFSYFINIPSGAAIIICLAALYIVLKAVKYGFDILVRRNTNE